MSDIAAIAGKLSEAQRRYLVGLQSRFGEWHSSWMEVGRPMLKLGLISFNPDKRQSSTCLTPLGQQVRDHLISKEQS